MLSHEHSTNGFILIFKVFFFFSFFFLLHSTISIFLCYYDVDKFGYLCALRPKWINSPMRVNVLRTLFIFSCANGKLIKVRINTYLVGLFFVWQAARLVHVLGDILLVFSFFLRIYRWALIGKYLVLINPIEWGCIFFLPFAWNRLSTSYSKCNVLTYKRTIWSSNAMHHFWSGYYLCSNAMYHFWSEYYHCKYYKS